MVYQIPQVQYARREQLPWDLGLTPMGPTNNLLSVIATISWLIENWKLGLTDLKNLISLTHGLNMHILNAAKLKHSSKLSVLNNACLYFLANCVSQKILSNVLNQSLSFIYSNTMIWALIRKIFFLFINFLLTQKPLCWLLFLTTYFFGPIWNSLYFFLLPN